MKHMRSQDMKKQTIKKRVLASIVAFSMLFGNNLILKAKNTEIITPQKTSLSILKTDTKVTAIIELSEDSMLDYYLADDGKMRKQTEASEYLSCKEGQAKIQDMIEKQNQVLKEMKRKIDYKLLYQYTTVINGLAVEVNLDDLTIIKSIKGVKRLFTSKTYETLEIESVDDSLTEVQKDVISKGQSTYEGRGIIVSIIDTGLDVNHSAFSNVIQSPKMTKETLKGVIESNSLNAMDIENGRAYVSNKIPFAYDYADQDADVNPTEQSIMVGNSHGTNVAGLIGAKCEELEGIAPQAQLFAMKVYDDRTGKAKTENILAAIEDSITLGADIINMSLGSACGFSDAGDSAIEEVYESVERAGINLATAAGNAGSSSMNNGLGNASLTSNPDIGTLYSPSTYNAAVSVANVSSEPDYISSWGTSPNLELKPEMAAPGIDVYTTDANNSYTVTSGTSISTPIVSGSYAVLREYINSHPIFSKLSQREQAELATNLLMSTAIPGRTEDGILFSPRRQGSGIVNLQNALATNVYLYTDEDVESYGKPKLNLYDDYEKKGEFSSQFHLKNFGEQEVTYQISMEALMDDIIPFEEFQELMFGYTLSEKVDILRGVSKVITDLVDFEFTTKNAIFDNGKLTVGAHADAEINVKFKLKEELMEYYNTYFPNGGFFEGYLLLENENSLVPLSVPYVGFYGDWTSAPLFDSGSAYDNNTYSQTFHVAYTNGGNAYLGINPFDSNMYYFLNNKYNPLYMKESYENYTLQPDPNKVAISPNGDGDFDALDILQLSQLRNAKELSVNVMKEDGEILNALDTTHVPKAIFRSNYGTVKPLMIQSVFDGEGCENNDVVTIEVTGNIDYDKHESHNVCDTYEMKVAVDLEKPELRSAVITEDNKLTVTMQDNQYASYIAIYQMDAENGPQMMDASFVNEDSRNKLTTLTFDISEYREAFEHKGDIMIVLYDYAMNQSNFVFQSDSDKTNVIQKYFGEDYEVECCVEKQWEQHFMGTIKIRNTGDKVIRNWALQFKASYEIEQIWNGTLQFQNDSGCAVEGQTWNQSIEIGQEVEIGFIARTKEEPATWDWCQVISYEKYLDKEEYNVQVSKTSEWKDGYKGEIVIENCSNESIKDWSLEFDTDSHLEILDNNYPLFQDGNHYVLQGASYKPNIEQGGKQVIKFIGTGNIAEFKNFSLRITENRN